MINRARLAAITFMCLSHFSSAQQSPDSINQAKMITPYAGWAASERQLFVTLDDGATWEDVTPLKSDDNRKIASAYFLNVSDGWVLLSRPNAAGDAAMYELATSHDSGSTWRISPISIPGLQAKGEIPDGAGVIDFVDSQSGWINLAVVSSSNFRRGLLLKTEDGGVSWRRPGDDPGISGAIEFVSTKHGWMAGGGGYQKLYETIDGGRSWIQINLRSVGAVPTLSTYDVPVFTDPKNGTLPVAFSGPDAAPTALAVYSTHDYGRSWKFERTVTTSTDLSGGQRLPIAVVEGNVILGSASTNALRTTKAGPSGQTTNVMQSRGGLGFRSVSFSSAQQGWAIVNGTGCELSRGQCGQISHLLSTRDAGSTWTDITPVIAKETQMVKSETVEGPESSVDDDSPTKSQMPSALPVYGTHVSERLGFDACTFPTTSKMSAWWLHSPFFDYGVYIGGINATCKTPVPASWVTTVVGQGWGLIPIWVGPQPSCFDPVRYRLIPSDPTKAQAQGVIEAKAAATKANGIGLSKTIIYYDLEGYTTASACGNAAIRAFLGAWTSTLKSLGFKAGIYVNAVNASDFTNLSSIPDDVWVAKYSSPAAVSIWGLSPLCDKYSAPTCTGKRLWSNQQRIHQYGQKLTSTYGGASIEYDPDIVDATVTGGNGIKPYSYTFTAFDYPGNYVGTVALRMNDRGVILGYAIDPSNNHRDFTLAKGLYTVLNYPGYHGPPSGFNGLNNVAQFAGSSSNDSSGSAFVGFTFSNAKFTTFKAPGATRTYGQDINDAGHVGGNATGSVYSSYLLTNGTFKTVPPYPGATAMFLNGLNGDSDFTGTYNGYTSGYVSLNGSFKPLAIGTHGTAPLGINSNAEVVGASYTATGGVYNGFVYQQGTYKTVNFPGAYSTVWQGTSDLGILVGFYIDASTFRIRGTVATPK